MLQTVRAVKGDKKWGHLSSFHVPFLRVMALKLSKKVHFLRFCANPSKKSKSIKALSIYASERSRCERSENGIVYYAMTYCFGDTRV